MGVYYKRVNMPVDCIVCPFGWNGCNNQHDFVYMGSRPDDCPLISIPEPHGRMIDADAFVEKCEEMANKEDGNQLDALVLLKWFLEQNAPTIIPAEEV